MHTKVCVCVCECLPVPHILMSLSNLSTPAPLLRALFDSVSCYRPIRSANHNYLSSRRFTDASFKSAQSLLYVFIASPKPISMLVKDG